MDPEAEISSSNSTYKRGKWITFPFIIGTIGCLSLASGGWITNLIVYLIEEFNVKSIDAAQIYNLVNAGMNFFPLVGAILADAFLGSFTAVAISCCFSFLALLAITSSSVIDSLRPNPCENGSSICQSPSKFQYAVLYVGLILGCLGFGVSRFTLSTMGAKQFDKQKDQGHFFNWFFFTFYVANVVSSTGIVYVQDNVSWGVGYGICLGASFIALLVFVSGNKFYRHDKPKGSPFTGLAEVVVASIRKIKTPNSIQHLNYQSDATSDQPQLPSPSQLTNTFRFLNKATIAIEGDTNPDGSVTNPWRLCTVQQVEDFKTLIRILPILSSSILVAVPVAVQGSLTVLQALAMDRQIGHLNIPAGSISVVAFISTSTSLTFIDQYFPSLWQKVMRKSPTPLQRIGIGHVLIALSMAVSAMVEKRRLRMNNDKEEMVAVWLFPQLILVGIGEAFYFPGQVGFSYQEFPASLSATATAMSSLIIGIAYYLSTAFVDIVRAHSDWLPNSIDHGRVDNVFWALVILGAINFGYFLSCAKYFKYQHNVEKPMVETS